MRTSDSDERTMTEADTQAEREIRAYLAETRPENDTMALFLYLWRRVKALEGQMARLMGDGK